MSTDGTGGVQASVAFDASEVDRGVTILQTAVQQSEAAIKELQSSLASGSITAVDFAAKLKVLQAEHRSLESAAKSMEKVQQAAAKQAADAAQAALDQAAAIRAVADAQRAAIQTATDKALADAAAAKASKDAADAARAQAAAAASSPMANNILSTYDVVGDDGFGVEQAHRATAANEEAANSYRRLVTEINATSTANQQHIVSVNGVTTAVHATATAQAAVSPRTMAATRAITDFSRAAEDFSTGGFLGIMNNIPGVMTNTGQALNVAAAKLALWTAGVSIAVAAGYLLYKNWDSITGLFEERNPFPKTTDSIDGMTEAIKTNNQALDELRKKQGLSNEELAKANKLLAENIRLEAERDEKRANKKAGEEFVKAPTDEAKEQGKAFGDAFKGIGKEVKGALDAAFELSKPERLAKNAEETAKRIAEIRKDTTSMDKVEVDPDPLKGVGLFNPQGPKEFKLVPRADRLAREEEEAGKKRAAAINAQTPGDMSDKLIRDINEGKAGAFEKFRGMMDGPAASEFTPKIRERFHSNVPRVKAARESDEAMRAIDAAAEGKLKEAGDKRLKDALSDFNAAGKDEDRHPRMKMQTIDETDRDRKATESARAAQEKKLDEAALKAANKALPGIGKMTEQEILKGRFQGGDAEAVGKMTEGQLAVALKLAGLDDDKAERGAKQIAAKAGENVQEDIIGRALKDEGRNERQKGSEVFGMNDLSNKIQSGVGSDEKADRKKMINLQELMVNALARQIPMAIAKAKAGVNLGVK